MSDFQQTVDLRDKLEKPSRPALKKPVSPIEKIYADGPGEGPKNDFHKISRPAVYRPRPGLIRLAVFILALAVVSAAVYVLFFRSKGAAVNQKAQAWYAVKLVDGEVFYGQIMDVKADPVAVSNVYYNYDQAKETAAGKKDLSQGFEETGNIRLVKRGQETHGPSGSMNIVRAQVLFMEPLKADSKVLRAILSYEK